MDSGCPMIPISQAEFGAGRTYNRKWFETHICAECQAPLSVRTAADVQAGQLFLACTNVREHHGFERKASMIEQYRRGTPMPVELANIAEKLVQRRRRHDPEPDRQEHV